MAFRRPKRRTYSENELYEYAVGALARRMRTVAELKRLLRPRVEEAETEDGQTLVELVIRRLKDQGYLTDSQYRPRIPLRCGGTTKSCDGSAWSRSSRRKGCTAAVIEKAVEAAYEGLQAKKKQAREYLSAGKAAGETKRSEARRRGFFGTWIGLGLRGSKTIVLGILKKMGCEMRRMLNAL